MKVASLLKTSLVNFLQDPTSKNKKITGAAEFSFLLVVQCTASDYIEY